MNIKNRERSKAEKNAQLNSLFLQFGSTSTFKKYSPKAQSISENVSELVPSPISNVS